MKVCITLHWSKSTNKKK